MHYFIEDDTALFIQPVVEKILFSVIIVGTSYMNVNIYAVGIHILLCMFDKLNYCRKGAYNDRYDL